MRSGTENVPAIAGIGQAAFDMYDNFDEIYVMDSNNMRNISYILDDPDYKIKKLCDYDIEDPW